LDDFLQELRFSEERLADDARDSFSAM